ncbi:MAG: TetR/AcrR family transcriptional regulator [Burkholderiales bacterium]|nr:TetR/AcrR family transcriptional regulator [Burkholderiales bacterium]
MNKPLKRPTQDRAKFTVQAIYDAFVRIWRRDGWERLTTRAVALETGISVGTLYDYFPNKLALLSGYVRHSMDVLLQAVEREAVQPAGLTWQQRLHQLVRLMCGVDAPELPWFDPGMLALEAQVAEPKHHRRVNEELTAAWQRVFDACTDLPRKPSAETLQAMHLSVWGGRRYALLLELDEARARLWAGEMEKMLCAVVSRG